MRSLNPLNFQFYRTRFFQLKETIAGNSHFLREEKQNNSKETNKKTKFCSEKEYFSPIFLVWVSIRKDSVIRNALLLEERNVFNARVQIPLLHFHNETCGAKKELKAEPKTTQKPAHPSHRPAQLFALEWNDLVGPWYCLNLISHIKHLFSLLNVNH